MVLQLLLLLMLMLLLLLMVTNPQTWLRPPETSGLTIEPYILVVLVAIVVQIM